MQLELVVEAAVGNSAKEGNSPVSETDSIAMSIQSTMKHEKFCGKTGGPSPKAKYDLVTDSELVP